MIDTKTIKPHMQGKVIQNDYDFITTLPERFCCYCLSDAQVQMILGQMDFYGWRTRWYSESGEIDQEVINALTGGLARALMSGCCGDDLSILIRFSPSGQYQTSSDGGSTWQDATSSDPRNAQPQFPPYLPDGTIDPTCTYADSIAKWLSNWLVNKLAEGNTYEQILAAITGGVATILTVLIESVLATIVIGLFGAVFVAILAIGIPAFQAAMTTDVYNRFKCNLKNHMNSDGTFTQSQIDAIYAQIATDETGIARSFLQAFVAAAGTTGLTNAAHSGYGAPDAECCPDGRCSFATWILLEDAGVIDTGTRTDHHVDITAILGGDGHWYVAFVAPTDDTCCVIHTAIDGSGQINTTSGAPNLSFYTPCGVDRNALFSGTGRLSLGFGDFNMNGFMYRGDATFSLRITS